MLDDPKEIEKIQLEIKKLYLEKLELERKWYLKPSYLSVLIPSLLTFGSLIYLFQNKNIEIFTQKWEVEKKIVELDIKLEKIQLDSVVHVNYLLDSMNKVARMEGHALADSILKIRANLKITSVQSIGFSRIVNQATKTNRISSSQVDSLMTLLKNNTEEIKKLKDGSKRVQDSLDLNQTMTNNPNGPLVSTYNITNLDDNNGRVTLNGYFNSNNVETATYFQYRKDGGQWIRVCLQKRGIAHGNLSCPVEELKSGNYEVRCVAVNTFGTTNYGEIIPFKIHSSRYG